MRLRELQPVDVQTSAPARVQVSHADRASSLRVVPASPDHVKGSGRLYATDRASRADRPSWAEPRRALSQIPLEPPHRCTLVLRRSALRVEMDELQRVLERTTLRTHVTGGIPVSA